METHSKWDERRRKIRIGKVPSRRVDPSSSFFSFVFLCLKVSYSRAPFPFFLLVLGKPQLFRVLMRYVIGIGSGSSVSRTQPK